MAHRLSLTSSVASPLLDRALLAETFGFLVPRSLHTLSVGVKAPDTSVLARPIFQQYLVLVLVHHVSKIADTTRSGCEA